MSIRLRSNQNTAQEMLYKVGSLGLDEIDELATPPHRIRRRGLGLTALATSSLITLVGIGLHLDNQEANRPRVHAEAEALRLAEIGEATQVLGRVVLVNGAHIRTEPIIVHTDPEDSLTDNTLTVSRGDKVLVDPIQVDLYDPGSNETHTWFGVHKKADATGLSTDIVWVRGDAVQEVPPQTEAFDPSRFDGVLAG